MFKTLKQFFDFCNKEDRNKLYLAIALGVVKAIFAALRITAIAVVVQGLIDGKMTQKHLLLALGIMVVSVLGQFCINLKTTMLQCEAGYHSCANKRIEIAEHLRYLPMGFFNKNSLGAITNVTTNTMESLADIATRIVMITTQGILTTAVITCFVLAFDWRIGLVLTAGIVLYILFNAVMQRATRPAAPRKHRADEDLVAQVIEYVQGIAEVKNYSMTDQTAKKLDAAITEKAGADTGLEFTVIPWVTMQNVVTKLTGVVMAILSLKFYFNGTMELLYCIMMIISAFMVYESLDSMSSFTALMRNIRIAVTKTKEIMDMPPMDIDGEAIAPKKRDIELKNVSFSYDKRKIIDGVSLTIPEKTTTAFVGPSGGGKTTLCHLMARFWDVQAGQVLLGGRNVKEYSFDSLMRNFSFVFQNVYLFADTIANNIRFGEPNAPMEKVIEAAKKARCHD
ncbi:MAG: ABC transporter ATP-binding protein, partial [Clostridia bacterium]|nr:ABC transporter ATP-binding protein [Clostridia bacterium]